MRGILLATLSLASCLYDVPPLGSATDASTDLGTTTEGGFACTCVPAIPSGWTALVYDNDMRPGCPAGYGAPTDWMENPTAPASTCTCTCTNAPLTQPTCTSTNVTFNVQFGPNNQCAGISGTVVAGAACNNGTWTFNSNMANGLEWVKASPAVPLTATGGTCTVPPPPTQTFPPPTRDSGRSCQLQAAIGACTSGDVCIPNTVAPYKICISKPGTNACPKGFGNAHVAGDGVSDARSCGPDACTCAVKATCNTTNLHLYTGTGCSLTQVANFAPDGTCQNVNVAGSNVTLQSARYNSPQLTNAMCAVPGTYAPTGGLNVTNPTTFCCR